jgi:hypothetical protein
LLGIVLAGGCGVLPEARVRLECGSLGPDICDAAMRTGLEHRAPGRPAIVAVAADHACPAGGRGCGRAVIGGEPERHIYNVVLLYEDGSADLLAFGAIAGQRWTDGWIHVGRIPGQLAEALGIEERAGTGLVLPVSFVPGQPAGTPVVLPADELQM